MATTGLSNLAAGRRFAEATAGSLFLIAGGSPGERLRVARTLALGLKRPLHRIDLAAVSSKYLGQTEKALRRLLDRAAQDGAVLFFDEADALFGKRSEVKDSHDRYAGIEIGYLLQRAERQQALVLGLRTAAAFDSAADSRFGRFRRLLVGALDSPPRCLRR